MLKIILEDIRGIRRRLDDHIDDEGKSIRVVQKDISKIREEMAGHKSRLAMISGMISVVVAGVVTWIASHLGLPK